MLFSTDAATDQIIATLAKDGKPETWSCSLISCDNPVCTCSSIEIVFLPLQDQNLQERPLAGQRLQIDLAEKKPADEPEDPASQKDFEFSNRFYSQITDDDYEFLLHKHMLYKQEITKTADINSIDIDFDYEAVEQTGFMYAYVDVLPYGRQMQFKIHDKTYMIVDQYCLQPRCPCTDVVLHVAYLEEAVIRKEIDLEEAEAYVIRLQYDKKRWAIEESPPNAMALSTLRSAIEEQVPDFYRQLKTRHEKMKAIYLHNRQKNYHHPQVIKDIKVGRNDPCPCGSGKKYKKCCL